MRYALLFLVLGCSSFDPTEVAAVRFIPPASYRMEWGIAEQCSGRQGDLRDVVFYVVPDSEAFETPKGRVLGNYNSHRHEITIAGGVLNDPFVVRHEMVHALGIQSHKNRAFRDCHAQAGKRAWDYLKEPLLDLPPSLMRYMP